MRIFEILNKVHINRQNCEGVTAKYFLKTIGCIYQFKNLILKFIDKIRIKPSKLIRFPLLIRRVVLKNHATKNFVKSGGAVLIEFAVAMPVLIILMMYIHDLALMKRYYDQMDFVALQMANMIQNISQKRATKTITKADLLNVVSAAYLTIYPDGRGQKYFPCVFTYYVKGNSNGTASCIWNLFHNKDTTDYLHLTNHYDPIKWNHTASVVRYVQNTAPSNIYSSLKINSGETKIIIDVCLEARLADRSAFGFRLISPKYTQRDAGWGWFFHAVVIFSPKPGLFSDTPPT